MTVGAVYRATVEDLRRHLGRHLVASLPVVALWALLTAGFYAVELRALPPIYAAWFWMEDELVSTVLYLLFAVVVPPLVATVPFVPLYVGMLHAERAWIDRREPLRLTSALSWGGVLLIPAALTGTPVWMLESVVWWAGMVPAVVVEATLGFGVAAVVVHGLRPGAAFRLSIASFVHAPLWRLRFATVMILVVVVSGLTVVPLILLPAFTANATIRAYRAWYGTGPVPHAL